MSNIWIISSDVNHDGQIIKSIAYMHDEILLARQVKRRRDRKDKNLEIIKYTVVKVETLTDKDIQ